MLGVSVKTLQRWDNDGILVANRTPTDRRFYTQEQIEEALNQKNIKQLKERGMAMEIKRGEIYKDSKDTLLLIVQNNDTNKDAETTVVIPLVNDKSILLSPLHVKLNLELNAAKEEYFALTEQMTSIIKGELKTLVSHISDEHIKEIETAVLYCLTPNFDFLK